MSNKVKTARGSRNAPPQFVPRLRLAQMFLARKTGISLNENEQKISKIGLYSI